MKLVVLSNTDWYLYNYRVPIDTLLREKGVETIMMSPRGDFADKIIEAGFKWYPIEMSRSGLNFMEERKTIDQIAKILKKEKPDVFHSFTMKGNINGTFAAEKAGVPKIINSITGLGFVYSSESLKAKLLRPFANYGYKMILDKGRTIFQNPDDLKSFVDKGLVSSKNVSLIRSSGVDLNKFSRTPVPVSDKIILLFAARLLWTKGVGELVEAAKKLHEKGLNIEVQIVGKNDLGNPASVPDDVISSWKKYDFIKCLGFRSDMPELVQKSTIVCFPSKHKEGTPKFLIEAAAAGRPIITTDNRGCKEVVIDGKNGYLTKVGSVDDIVDAVIKMTRSPENLQKMGDASYKIAQEFNVVDVANQSYEVYNS